MSFDVMSMSLDYFPNVFFRLSEKVEAQYEEFLALAPDPFDDRHPCRIIITSA